MRRPRGLALLESGGQPIQVAVVDQRLDEELHLDVPSACALDAFHHPFAYAAVKGLGFGYGMRACGDLQPLNLTERSAV